MQRWWVHPSTLALTMLAGFAFVIGMTVVPNRSPAIDASRDRG